uniref:histone H1.8 n=1 Tax=Callithrix jacchus TaxID=9483 RepID=UPI0023DD5F54|nr:histone H1.8 [Callithrix jacchus]
MASRSVTSKRSPSSTSTEGSSRSPESEKPGSHGGRPPNGPSRSSFPVGRRHPPTLQMVLEAMQVLQAEEQRQGTSVVAIKRYILRKYPAADGPRFKYLLKNALATGMCRGLLARPPHLKTRGATGSFQLVTNHERTIKPRKTASPKAPRRAGVAKGKVPKKPDEAKEEPPKAGKGKKGAKSPAEVQKPPLKPGTDTEKACKESSKAKDTEAQPGEAQKVPPKPDKAMRAPSNDSGFSRRAEVKGSWRSPANCAEASRKTKAGSKSLRPTVSKVKSGTASLTEKKSVARAKAQSQAPAPTGAGQGPNAKGASAKAGGSKVVPAHLSRKTEAPKGSRTAGLPIDIKFPSSKVSSQRAEAWGRRQGWRDT